MVDCHFANLNLFVCPEYGMGRKISAEGNVSSYGILLLEMLWGKRPTGSSIIVVIFMTR